MRKITIEDISRDTGLSRGTVSRALNDRPDISTQTKQRVIEACDRLKYVPSHAARSLATGRNYAVTVLVQDLQTAYAAEIIRGVMRSAQAVHYAVQVIETGINSVETRFAALAPERIDAVLNTLPLNFHDATQLRDNLENRLLTSTWPLDGVACDAFTPDFAEAGRMAARLLLRNGLREILYLHSPGRLGADEQLRGFQEVCRENGINPEDSSAVVENSNALDDIKPRILRAQGVAAANDYLACTAMMIALAGGRRPGADLAIIGYGNETLAEKINPDLTSLDPDGEEMGRRMMDAVLQRLGHERSETPEHTLIAPQLIQRATTRHLMAE